MKSIRAALFAATAVLVAMPLMAQGDAGQNWRRGDRPPAVRDDPGARAQRPAPMLGADVGQRRAEWRANRGQFDRSMAPPSPPQPSALPQPSAPPQPSQFGNRGQGARSGEGASRQFDGRWNRGDAGRGQNGNSQWNRDARNNGQFTDGRWNGTNDRERHDDAARRWSEDRRIDANRRWDNDRRFDGNRRGDHDWRGGDRLREANRFGRYDNHYGRYDNRPNLNWRDDRRYDWRSYRDNHRDIFRGRYYAPRGYAYRSIYRGFLLEPFFYGSSYWLNDPFQYRLPPVEWPYRWVRYYNDAALVDTTTGQVVDVIQNFFW